MSEQNARSGSFALILLGPFGARTDRHAIQTGDGISTGAANTADGAGSFEERGSGWDKVAGQVELYQLPAPEVLTADTTRVTLLSPRPLTEMTPDEEAQAVYLHSCLNQVSRKHATNDSVRQRRVPEATALAALLTTDLPMGEATRGQWT